MSTIATIPEEAVIACCFTGKKDGLVTYAHRNLDGNIVGFLFVHKSLVERMSKQELELVIPELK